MTADPVVRVGRATARDGSRIYYAAGSGTGVPLVFVEHLCFVHVDQQLDLASERASIDAAAAGSPWFMFDWRGEGGSSPISGPLTFEQLVDDLEAVVLEAGEPCDIQTWITGQVAIAFAERRPDLVRRILLIDPWTGADDPGLPLFRAGWAADPVGTMSAMLLWMEESMSLVRANRLAQEWYAGLGPGSLEQFRALRDAWPELGSVVESFRTPMAVVLTNHEADHVSAVADRLPGTRILPMPEGARNGGLLGAVLRRLWDDVNPVPESTPRPSPGGATSTRLTPRELEVLGLVAEGLQNDEIAARLSVTPATAARHVSNIFDKLGVHNRAMATDAAHRLGLLGPRQAR